jgi:CRP/FNR family transcriptional regulator, cyclic AMP receptor protein
VTDRRLSRTIVPMNEILEQTADLPEHDFARGEAVVREGGAASGIWILVSGALQVRKGDVLVNMINQPGAMIGEISVLLNTSHGATVEASVPSRLRFAKDGEAFLSSDPAICRLVAMGLAERLNFVTTYLADLKHQYGDAPGLAMVSDVLAQLAQRQAPLARPGSVREPNPEY